MKKTLRTETEILAPADHVWQVLTDFAAYADWNPFIVYATGRPTPGSRLALRRQPVDGRPMTVLPTVLKAVPGQLLLWRGRLGLPGVLDAEHRFTLQERSDGTTRLVQNELFRGALVRLVSGSLDRGTLPAFRLMDAALKARTETTATARRD